jgi:hypothetical protein
VLKSVTKVGKRKNDRRKDKNRVPVQGVGLVLDSVVIGENRKAKVGRGKKKK